MYSLFVLCATLATGSPEEGDHHGLEAGVLVGAQYNVPVGEHGHASTAGVLAGTAIFPFSANFGLATSAGLELASGHGGPFLSLGPEFVVSEDVVIDVMLGYLVQFHREADEHLATTHFLFPSVTLLFKVSEALFGPYVATYRLIAGHAEAETIMTLGVVAVSLF